MNTIDDLLAAFADPGSPAFDAVDAHRARQAELAAVPVPEEGTYSAAYEYALNEAVHAEAAAQEVLANVLGLPQLMEPAWPAVMQSGPVDWSRSGRAA